MSEFWAGATIAETYTQNVSPGSRLEQETTQFVGELQAFGGELSDTVAPGVLEVMGATQPGASCADPDSSVEIDPRFRRLCGNWWIAYCLQFPNDPVCTEIDPDPDDDDDPDDNERDKKKGMAWEDYWGMSEIPYYEWGFANNAPGNPPQPKPVDDAPLTYGPPGHYIAAVPKELKRCCPKSIDVEISRGPEHAKAQRTCGVSWKMRIDVRWKSEQEDPGCSCKCCKVAQYVSWHGETYWYESGDPKRLTSTAILVPPQDGDIHTEYWTALNLPRSWDPGKYAWHAPKSRDYHKSTWGEFEGFSLLETGLEYNKKVKRFKDVPNKRMVFLEDILVEAGKQKGLQSIWWSILRHDPKANVVDKLTIYDNAIVQKPCYLRYGDDPSSVSIEDPEHEMVQRPGEAVAQVVWFAIQVVPRKHSDCVPPKSTPSATCFVGWKNAWYWPRGAGSCTRALDPTPPKEGMVHRCQLR